MMCRVSCKGTEDELGASSTQHPLQHCKVSWGESHSLVMGLGGWLGRRLCGFLRDPLWANFCRWLERHPSHHV